MKNYIFLFIALLFWQCAPTETTHNQESIRAQITAKETHDLLYTLADDSMMGRDTQSGGYYRAADYVTRYFKEHNITPFYPAYRDSLVTDSLVSYNVVGKIGEFLPNRKTILIGAHLDHLGMKLDEKDIVFNGANDNATGVTAVLQIARYLGQHKWNQNILVALFADEEKGLKGAYHLAERFKNEKIALDYMVNFEMIGTVLSTGENKVYMTGFKRSEMAEKMNAISPGFVEFLKEAKAYNLFKRSDNYAFYEAFKIPAHTLASFDFKNYDHYHKASDEIEALNIDNMNAIIGTAAFTLAQLLKKGVEIQMLEEEKEERTPLSE